MTAQIKTTSPKSTTDSERYLAHLCRKTFLRFWSYPNPYRDQNWGSGRTGKELCDLLAIFGDHVLIFSDKDCAFPTSESREQNWKRWYKRAVYKSAQQVLGAERWIQNHPDRIFLDSGCNHSLPIRLPRSDKVRFHRIIVANGAAEASRTYFGGGSGSLVINNQIGVPNLGQAVPANQSPFSVGHVDVSKGFFHILNEVTFDLLIQTLDTLPDFIRYLEKKEEFIDSDRPILVSGEENLLAFYLANINYDNEHDFSVPNEGAIGIDEGLWRNYLISPERSNKESADRISYTWDSIIEKFAKHIDEGTRSHGTHHGRRDNEIALRMLAREDRFSRRLLSKALLGNMQNGDREDRATRITARSAGGTTFSFLTLKKTVGRSQAEYRTFRRHLLEAQCMVTKLHVPTALDVVGIATGPMSDIDQGEDLIYSDVRDWSSEDETQAKEYQSKFRLLMKPREVRYSENEYPAKGDSAMPKGRNRNSPCFCGSGKKFKKCCGKRN